MAGRKGQRSGKPAAIPAKFSEGFLQDLDGRCKVAKELQARLAELQQDLGGIEALSYSQRSLCKRAIWLEAWIESKETSLAQGKENGDEVGKLIQATNSLLGIYKVLGLQRKAKELTLTEVLRKGNEK